jgi:hypothetical protein
VPVTELNCYLAMLSVAKVRSRSVSARQTNDCAWSTGAMILTGGNRANGSKTCHNATLSTTNLTLADLGSNPGLRGERPVTSRLSDGTVD